MIELSSCLQRMLFQARATSKFFTTTDSGVGCRCLISGQKEEKLKLSGTKEMGCGPTGMCLRLTHDTSGRPTAGGWGPSGEEGRGVQVPGTEPLAGGGQTLGQRGSDRGRRRQRLAARKDLGSEPGDSQARCPSSGTQRPALPAHHALGPRFPPPPFLCLPRQTMPDVMCVCPWRVAEPGLRRGC